MTRRYLPWVAAVLVAVACEPENPLATSEDLLPSFHTTAPPGYEIPLGTLGGTWTQIMDLDDRDRVVGQSERADGVQQALNWEDGVMQALPRSPETPSNRWAWNHNFHVRRWVRGFNDRGETLVYVGLHGRGHRLLLTSRSSSSSSI